jgi:ABC-type branched-subunit amino acid transport system substrate-binding protein
MAFAVAVTACSTSSAPPTDEIKVGLLLPFTGADSATSGNFERAVLFAKDRVNAVGGVGGHNIRVISADTHSDVTRARDSAQTLIDAGVSVIIGPESADVAAFIKTRLDLAGVVFLSPLVGAANEQTVDCTTPWFRLAPSARALGEALSKRAFADGMQKVHVFRSDGAYDEALAVAFRNRFVSLGGTIIDDDTVLPPNLQSYSDRIPATSIADAQALLLTAPPRSAALLVNDLRSLAPTQQPWYLSPQLKTDIFLQNVAPGALEGAIGVTPQIFDTGTEFPAAFSAHWAGDEPLDGAYFYFDAMTLLSFAFEKALATDPTSPTPSADGLRQAILAVVGPNGQSARWTELADALPRVGQNEQVYYTGLTGPLLFLPCGDRRTGSSAPWEVQMGHIQE